MFAHLTHRFPCLLLLLVLAGAVNARAAEQLWSLPLKQDAKWHSLTELGVLLVGTESAIHCINPETGAELWKRTEFTKSSAFNAREIPGTPFLLCNTYNGFMGTKTTLHLINYLEGSTLWTSPELMGQYMGTIPIPDKGMVVLVMSMFGQGKSDDINGIALLGYEIATGKELWRTKFAKAGAIPMHIADGSGKFVPRMDLSGYHDPLVEGDNLYLPYLGIHCVDLASGGIKWAVEFPPGNKGFKKTNSPLRIDGDMIYGSGGGSVYAVNKQTGAQLWNSERISNFGGLFKARHNAIISQIETVGDKVFMRFGGNFSNGRAVSLLEPLGVVVLDKETGKLVSDHDVKEGMTNLMVVPEAGVVMYADAYNLIGLDVTGNAAEKFKTKIEFKRKMGGGEIAQIGLGLTGGLLGAVKAVSAQNKARLDVPVAITRRAGHIVVQGKQHLISFDPAAGTIKWSTYYAAPGEGFGMTALFAVTAMTSLAGNAQAAGSTFGSSGYSSGVNTIHSGLDNYNKAAGKRKSATQSSDNRAYILTKVEDGKAKGIGLMGIGLETGEAEKKLILGTKEPEYQVDELADRIFFFKGKDTIIAYQL